MPRLTVVIPMFNEAARLETGVQPVLDHLSARHPGAEVFLVNDGSTDDTAARARGLLEVHPALQGEVLSLPRTGKGGAVREGMRRGTGEIRIFLDADNATPIEELDRLLPFVTDERTIVIASRGIDRSLLERRQPWWRERMGRTFNLLLRTIVDLPYKDTQCGFKLFGREAAEICFSRQTLDGFAFDVELLWIARKEGLKVLEIPVRWRHVPDSRVHPIRHSFQMATDALRIRLRH
jgi:dolichyl-phosphate beta-glucosyltransferase